LAIYRIKAVERRVMIPVSTSVLMVLLKPLRVLSAVRIQGDVERRRRVSAKQRRAKNVRLFLGNLRRNKADQG
jgi:hypothetical protein